MQNKQKFSIVFQGAYESRFAINVLDACKYTDDVVLAVWKNSISPIQADEFARLGVSVVLIDDPGSIVGYEQDSVVKKLNVKRLFTGLFAGANRSRYEYIIKTRLDIRINFEKYYNIWMSSQKSISTLNISSNCPTRLFGYPFLFSISDWCIGFSREHISLLDPSFIDEEIFIRPSPVKIRDMIWHTRLSTEQIICLTLVKMTGEIVKHKNLLSCHEYTEAERKNHKLALSQICNISREGLQFVSLKYRAIGSRWINYDSLDFSDDSFLKLAPWQFFVFIGARILKLFR